jgi:hypothetical protein
MQHSGNRLRRIILLVNPFGEIARKVPASVRRNIGIATKKSKGQGGEKNKQD